MARGEDYWNRLAGNYDRSMLLFGRSIPRMAELAAEAVRGRERVLEVAAGTGLVTPSLARAAKSVVATDYAAAMVARVEARLRREGLENVRCEQADIYELTYEPASFDAVVAANVLHLVPDLEAALRALARVLKPGGILVTPTYCHDQTWLAAGVSRILALASFPGARRFNLGRLQRAIEASGRTITRTELLPGILPIAHVESRARGQD